MGSSKRHWIYQTLQAILVGLISGWILYQSFAPNNNLIISLAVIALMLIPFIFLWKAFAKKALIAILFLAMSFNIDQTLFLRDHLGGAKGLIVSLNGLVIFILYLIYLQETVQRGKSDFRLFKPVVFPLLGLVMMALLSLLGAPDRALGLFEWLEISKMFVIFLYVKYAMSHECELEFILKIILAGIILESVIGTIQFFTGSSLNLTLLGGRSDVALMDMTSGSVSRVGGTLGGPNAFAWYLDFLLPIPLAMILIGRGKRHLLLNATAFCLGGVALFMTFSRGGWLSMLLSGFIVLAYLITKLTLVKRLYTILIMILIACIGVILIVGIANPVRDRFLAEDGGAAYVRIPLMEVAVNMIRHHPVTGVGLNNYTLVHQNYDNTPGRVSSYFPYPVHNTMLQLCAETGVIGLLFFIVFFVVILYQARGLIRSENATIRAVGVGLFAALIGAMVQAQVENASIGSSHLLPLWMLSGLVSGLREKENLSTHESKEKSANEIR
jgi:putative inorganic carbon (HCO3(-)) transporter